ncbi:hypothetical protein L484_022142 [Morus notabilis]|uniref:Uncharacterized protein n=1 Tax=Morus notabilis TaxID=981085 RepID=W9QDU3_9ROSA|nr:hypothetical protein L484_022142 [Morus notabilis]
MTIALNIYAATRELLPTLLASSVKVSGSWKGLIESPPNENFNFARDVSPPPTVFNVPQRSPSPLHNSSALYIYLLTQNATPTDHFAPFY